MGSGDYGAVDVLQIAHAPKEFIRPPHWPPRRSVRATFAQDLRPPIPQFVWTFSRAVKVFRLGFSSIPSLCLSVSLDILLIANSFSSDDHMHDRVVNTSDTSRLPGGNCSIHLCDAWTVLSALPRAGPSRSACRRAWKLCLKNVAATGGSRRISPPINNRYIGVFDLVEVAG